MISCPHGCSARHPNLLMLSQTRDTREKPSNVPRSGVFHCSPGGDRRRPAPGLDRAGQTIDSPVAIRGGAGNPRPRSTVRTCPTAAENGHGRKERHGGTVLEDVRGHQLSPARQTPGKQCWGGLLPAFSRGHLSPAAAGESNGSGQLMDVRGYGYQTDTSEDCTVMVGIPRPNHAQSRVPAVCLQDLIRLACSMAVTGDRA